MLRETIAVIYLAMIPVSWLLISGWVYAEDSAFSDRLNGLGGTKRSYSAKDSGFAVIWSVFPALLWPIFLLGVYCSTGYAEHGWKPIWRIK